MPPTVNEHTTGETAVVGGAVYVHVCAAVDPAANVSSDGDTSPAPVQLMLSVTPVKNGAVSGVKLNEPDDSPTASDAGADTALKPDVDTMLNENDDGTV